MRPSSPPRRSAIAPTATRAMTPARPPTVRLSPAKASEAPMSTAYVVRNDPSGLAAPEPRHTATARTSSRRSAPLPSPPRRPCGARGPSPATGTRASSAKAAAATNAHRHPKVSATAGTLSPPSMVHSGTAACLAPNSIPLRRLGAQSARTVLAAICPRPLAGALSSSRAVRTTGSCAAAAMASIEPAVRPTARRAANGTPKRSTHRPAGTAVSPQTAK